jgi:methylthioribulose-1-phosphate dehydratase
MSLTATDNIAREIAEIGRRFYARGWALGTGGNYSCLVSSPPLLVAVTASAVHKGNLTANEVLLIDENAAPVGNTSLKPSAECLLHVEIINRRMPAAGAVLHTHSIWNTVLSDFFAPNGCVVIQGYEMQKGLRGVKTHESREIVPIVENDQDMTRLAESIGKALDENPLCHGVLLRRHGLYTWGQTLAEAERHVEILEFLLEAMGRTLSLPLRQQEASWHS